MHSLRQRHQVHSQCGLVIGTAYGDQSVELFDEVERFMAAFGCRHPVLDRRKMHTLCAPAFHHAEDNLTGAFLACRPAAVSDDALPRRVS
jgi:hypothetical protein